MANHEVHDCMTDGWSMGRPILDPCFLSFFLFLFLNEHSASGEKWGEQKDIFRTCLFNSP
jgi:hypothetical protein